MSYNYSYKLFTSTISYEVNKYLYFKSKLYTITVIEK